MNLKEEMDLMADRAERYAHNAPVVYIDNAIEIAESYAKGILLKWVEREYGEETDTIMLEINEWWEENK